MRFFKTILKYFLLLLVALALLGLLYIGISKYAETKRNKPIHGELSFNPTLKTNSYQIGDFEIEWNKNGTLQIWNNNRVIWQNQEGEQFISLSEGEAEIHESRGSFSIKDKIVTSYSNQHIQSISFIDSVLVFNGTVTGASNDSLSFRFELSQVKKGQLQFYIKSDNKENINRIHFTYRSEANEKFMGFGMQFSSFNMKGKRLPILVQEQGIGRGAQPLTFLADITNGAGGSWHSSYAGVPHYISSNMNSLMLDHYEYSIFDMRADDYVQIKAFGSELKGRILAGESPTELIENYTSWCGRMKPLPEWTQQGAIIGMQGGTEKVRKIWNELKSSECPIAGFWLQDWEGQRTTSFGKQLWWNWELDRDHYPNWSELTNDLAAENIYPLIYINPFLVDVDSKENHRRNLFSEAKKAGYLIKSKNGDPYLIPNTSFSAGLVDISNPQAYTWMKEVIKTELLPTGAKGWMADFGEALPFDAQIFDGEASAFHNKYPEQWAKLNREVIEEIDTTNQYFFFSRSGYSQSPKYSPAFWLGDQMVTWDEHDGIKTAVTGLLSSGLSGYSINHSDIGGYTTITNPPLNYVREKELLLRWIELNAFTVLFRSHEGNRPDDNVQIYSDQECIDHISKFAKIFKILAPYRHRLMNEAYEKGLPIVRHPFIHYPNDENIYSIKHEQFMLGDEMMIAPVLDLNTKKVSCYLPEGDWIHIWSNKTLTGGKSYTIDAPIGEPAIFVKSKNTIQSLLDEIVLLKE